MERSCTEVEGSALVPAAAPAAGWRAVGAAVRGTGHVRSNLPCQDAVAYRTLPGDVLLCAVADGAGTAALSDQGAQRAVTEAIACLTGLVEKAPQITPRFLEEALQKTFSAARQAVLRLADPPEAGPTFARVYPPLEDSLAAAASPGDAGEPVLPQARDFACTLTCVAALPGLLAVGQIGDGAVVAADEEGQLFMASQLQRGEYANETHFLTQPDALECAVWQILDRPVRSLAVMSDGLIRLALKMPVQEPHGPFFQPLFQFARTQVDPQAGAAQLSVFLDSPRVNERTDDDKSLILAVWLDESAGPAKPALEAGQGSA